MFQINFLSKGDIMKKYHYKLADLDGVPEGYFRTKQELNQYLLNEFPTPERGDSRGNLLPKMFQITRQKHSGLRSENA